MTKPKTPSLAPASVSVLVARAALVLLALGLAIAGLSVAVHDHDTESAAARYACPMHPEVTSAKAAECPICKMALEPKNRTREVTPRAPRAQSSSRRGIPTTDSPTLGKTWLPETFPPAASARPSDRPVLETPRRRTLVSGVRAHAWLETSERLAAVLYRDELVGLAPGESGVFYTALSPRAPVSVRMSGDEPAAWDASTVLVRFSVVASAGEQGASGGAGVLAQGAVGRLELEPRARELLTFPESALLRSSEGPYVLVAGTEGALTRRSVQIGRVVKGQVVVLGGLAENDRVVAGNAFFLDALAGHTAGSEPVAEIRR